MNRSLVAEHDGRSLQRLCRIYDDLYRGEYKCTLEEYCKVLNEENDSPITCVGDLEGEFSIVTQDYLCHEPGSAPIPWLPVDHPRICFTSTERIDFFQTTGIRVSQSLDFVEGFDFNYFGVSELCPDDFQRQCGCAGSIEGRQCNSCKVCNNGALDASANAYFFEFDCTNIAEGLTRDCDASCSWGDFFARVDEIAPSLSQPSSSSTNTIQTQSPTASPTNSMNHGVANNASSNKGLSAAALGGMVGGIVGVALATLLAIVLVYMLRRWRKDRGRSGKAKQSNQATSVGQDSTSGSDIHVSTADQSSPPHVMADVMLLDENPSPPQGTTLGFPFIPTKTSGKPGST